MPIANSPEVKRLFAEKDRDGLYEYVKESFYELQQNGISQSQFHITDVTSFLRVHEPEKTYHIK